MVRILTRLSTAVLTICFFFQGCAFSERTTLRLFNEVSNEQFDVVIVPGVPYDTTGWSRTMKGRVYWSKFLYDKGIAKNIMYSGSAVYSPYCEAEIMALYAEAIGIPKEHIHVETKAEHSTENIYYSYHKAKSLGFQKIALASDPFQSKLLRRFTRKRVSPEVRIIPFVVDTLKMMHPAMKDPAINHQLAFKQNFVSIVRRESFWKRFKGTRGGNLDTTAYRP
jgi:uncharacterized SAM-binding protein YcdF (DUF218 family)